MLKTYVIDPAHIPWKESETEGIRFRCQVLLPGDDGGPEALRFRFDPTPSVYAHMHLTAQFQLLLGGAMDFPRGALKLRPPAVHYTDHNVPYGPFATSAGHEMLVLHPKQGGLISMANRDARRQIYLPGRVLTGMEQEAQWVEHKSYRIKTLIPAAAGPEALLMELPAHATLQTSAAPYGRYEVVIAGSAIIEGTRVGKTALRFSRGEVPPGPLKAGPDGALLMRLTFDKNALEGGLTGEGIAVAAAEAMARAI